MYRRILLSLVAIGVLASFMGLGGLSLFTATTDNDGNAFTSGSVDISTSPASAFLMMSNMAPGDSVTEPLTVNNDGTLDLRYAMTTDAVDGVPPGLAAVLTLEIRDEGTDCPTFDGNILYNSSLDLNLGYIGDPTPGGDLGDREITVAAGSEVLCFRVTLPSDATGPEGASTTVTFTFDAEQTKNNP